MLRHTAMYAHMEIIKQEAGKQRGVNYGQTLAPNQLGGKRPSEPTVDPNQAQIKSTVLP